jgi:glycerol uptake facilitator protein
MSSPVVGEFMGTTVLILFGDGVVASVLLKKCKAEGAGWMVIATGWAFAVLMGVFTAIAFGSSDAHINPAVTLCFAIVSGNFAKVIPYWIAQMAGAFTGATLVWLHFMPHWKETPDQGLKLAVFSTGPAIRNIPWNLWSEVLGTFVLLLGIACIFSKNLTATGLTPGLGPYFVACLVWVIGLCLGATTGYAINPARDLGPRIAHAVWPIAGKGSSDWGYALVPVIGPLVGGSIGALVIKLAHL